MRSRDHAPPSLLDNKAVDLNDNCFFVLQLKPFRMNYYVYILYSPSRDRYYTGYTSDIQSRLEKHNAGATPSTRPGIPWEMVYTETFRIKHDAIVREREIKEKKSRSYIENLIRTHQG
jgi:putative endonuclease